MYQKFKTIEGATKNVAMGAETIQKTRVSLKNQKSKVNFVNLK
jgi:hypothetical protein